MTVVTEEMVLCGHGSMVTIPLLPFLLLLVRDRFSFDFGRLRGWFVDASDQHPKRCETGINLVIKGVVLAVNQPPLLSLHNDAVIVGVLSC